MICIDDEQSYLFIRKNIRGKRKENSSSKCLIELNDDQMSIIRLSMIIYGGISFLQHLIRFLNIFQNVRKVILRMFALEMLFIRFGITHLALNMNREDQSVTMIHRRLLCKRYIEMSNQQLNQ
jgi:hypothetical protein